MEKYREFSNVINDRDLWINKDPRGEIFQNLHHMYDDELFVKRMLENDSFDLSHDEQLLLDFQKRKSDQYQKFLLQTIEIKTDENGFSYGVIYGSGVGSNLLDRAIHDHDLEYALLVNLNAQRASIRSRGNFDCAEFAVKRGGGGHKCAAGFSVDFKLPVL